MDIVTNTLFPADSPFQHQGLGYFPVGFGSLTCIVPEVTAACQYRYEVVELVRRAKLFGQTAIADEMGDILLRVLSESSENELEYDVVTCVPADPRRMVRRGYHIPARIAAQIARITSIPFLPLAHKNHHTQSQTSLSKIERAENVKHVFSGVKIPQESAEQVKKVLLIDDTVTTGATLLAVRNSILQANPGIKVVCVAFAAAPLETR